MEDIIVSVPEACGDKDCSVGWHIAHYWGYDDGTFTVCDSDGDHDPVDEADIPSAEQAEAMWIDYSRHVAETGLDPLGEFMVKRTTTRKERWQFRFARSILGVALVAARHAGRDYVWHQLPVHVADYLTIEGKSPRLHGFKDWAEFVAAVPDIKPRQWHVDHIDRETPRAPEAIRADLIRLARKHLREAKKHLRAA